MVTGEFFSELAEHLYISGFPLPAFAHRSLSSPCLLTQNCSYHSVLIVVCLAAGKKPTIVQFPLHARRTLPRLVFFFFSNVVSKQVMPYPRCSSGGRHEPWLL